MTSKLADQIEHAVLYTSQTPVIRQKEVTLKVGNFHGLHTIIDRLTQIEVANLVSLGRQINIDDDFLPKLFQIPTLRKVTIDSRLLTRCTVRFKVADIRLSGSILQSNRLLTDKFCYRKSLLWNFGQVSSIFEPDYRRVCV